MIDPRIVTLAVCAALALASCKREDAERAAPVLPAITAAAVAPVVLATVADGTRPPDLSAPSSAGLHAAEPAELQFVFSERGGGVAFVIERGDEVQVVHNGRAGAAYAAVGAVALSPDGVRVAYGALSGGAWRMVVDGAEGEPFSTVKAPVFSADGKHLAYQAMRGERWHLVVDGRVNAGTPSRYLAHALGADGARLVYVEAEEGKNVGRLVVTDPAFAAEALVASRVAGLVVDDRRRRAAAVEVVEGGQQVVALDFDRPDAAVRGARYERIEGLAFAPDGASLAYLAQRGGRRIVVLEGQEATFPEGEPAGPLVVRPGGMGAGVLVAGRDGVRLHHLFADAGAKGSAYEGAEGLAYGGDGRSWAFVAQRRGAWFLVVDGVEGPPYDRAVSPSFSPDGRHVVFRARKDGQRFVVVADGRARTKAHHPAYEQVFPVLFTPDGKATAYGVKDGPRLAWKVEAL